MKLKSRLTRVSGHGLEAYALGAPPLRGAAYSLDVQTDFVRFRSMTSSKK